MAVWLLARSLLGASARSCDPCLNIGFILITLQAPPQQEEEPRQQQQQQQHQHQQQDGAVFDPEGHEAGWPAADEGVEVADWDAWAG